MASNLIVLGVFGVFFGVLMIAIGISCFLLKRQERKAYVHDLELRKDYSAFFKKHDQAKALNAEMCDLRSKMLKLEEQINKKLPILNCFIANSIQYEKLFLEIQELREEYEEVNFEYNALSRKRKLIVNLIKQHPVPEEYDYYLGTDYYI